MGEEGKKFDLNKKKWPAGHFFLFFIPFCFWRGRCRFANGSWGKEFEYLIMVIRSVAIDVCNSILMAFPLHFERPQASHSFFLMPSAISRFFELVGLIMWVAIFSNDIFN
jgi:hypothetical protein